MLVYRCEADALQREHGLRASPVSAHLPYALSIEFQRELNVNLAASFLDTLLQAIKITSLTSADLTDVNRSSSSSRSIDAAATDETSVAQFSPFRLCNQTGMPIAFSIAHHEAEETQSLPADAECELDLSAVLDAFALSQDHREIDRLFRLNLSVADCFRPIQNIAVGQLGTQVYACRPYKSGVALERPDHFSASSASASASLPSSAPLHALHIAVRVVQRDGAKIVQVRSLLALQNCTTVPLRFLLRDTDGTRSAELGPVEPGTTTFVPLQLASLDQIFVQPCFAAQYAYSSRPLSRTALQTAALMHATMTCPHINQGEAPFLCAVSAEVDRYTPGHSNLVFVVCLFTATHNFTFASQREWPDGVR